MNSVQFRGRSFSSYVGISAIYRLHIQKPIIGRQEYHQTVQYDNSLSKV